MTTKIKRLLLALTLLVFQVTTFAQKNNYTGTWILNLEKSKLEHRPAGLTKSIFIIKQEGDQFKLTRYHIFGDKKKKISFTMTADAQTRRIKLLFKGKLEWKDDNLQASLWRKNFSNIVNYKFGATHNEFIADEVFKGLPQDHHNIWVFDRQTAS